MKTMREKWICPNMDVQVFTPQEYCKICTDKQVTVKKEWVNNQTQFWDDTNQDHLINGTDYKGTGYGTDNSAHDMTIDFNTSGFRWVWWANVGATVLTAIQQGKSDDEIWRAFLQDQTDHKAGYGGGVVKKGGSGHRFSGDVIEFSMS